MATQTLQQELNERWLALGGDMETQECVIMLLRRFTDPNLGMEGLPHYQEALARQEQEIKARYTTFGELAVGNRFFHFGHEYQKTEPTQVLQWVNCESDRGQTYMGDGFVVEKVESQDNPDPDLSGAGTGA